MSARKVQTKPNLFNDKLVVVFGTSQTSLESAPQYGVPAYKANGPKLQEKLRLAGARVRVKTFGRGGDISSNALGRAYELNRYGAPNTAHLEMGVNDVFCGITGTAAAGTANTITLGANSTNIVSGATAATITLVNSYVGNTITITAGTGSGQTRTIIDYTTSKVATVDTPWTTVPDNSSVYSIPNTTTAQLQANNQALIKILKYNVVSPQVNDSAAPYLVTVWNQTLLPKSGVAGQRIVVMNDSSTTGGVKENHPSMHPTITGNYSSAVKQSVWEYRFDQPGELGWGRVAINTTAAFAEGCSKITIIGSNYQNWSSAGDSYNVNTSSGTQYAAYVPVRQAAKDAAAAEGVVYCDLYAFQSMLIYGGTFLNNLISAETAQNSGAFHYIPTNQHYSAYGHDTVARALYYQIVREGWLTTLL